ncbi:MAG: NUDIX hydrolase [Candidatus Eisenbacteria bacterium]|nr:NUDIX hydrolase [Candidatus Eisenbacteria bacterium]
MQPWKTLSRRIILDEHPWLVVEHHTVELPDGRIIPDWPWIVTPDYVSVVAITESNTFACFRQTKYAIEGISLAPVAGYIDPGEEPLAAAQRELREEAGLVATEWLEMGHYRVDGNRGSGTGHFFLARQAKAVAPFAPHDIEEQELVYLTRAEIEEALAKGEFKALGWAAAFAFVLLRTKT